MGITAGVTFYMRKVEGGFQTLCPELEANAISLILATFRALVLANLNYLFILHFANMLGKVGVLRPQINCAHADSYYTIQNASQSSVYLEAHHGLSKPCFTSRNI